MGDHTACDVAQAVHQAVLERTDALPSERLVRGRRPLPCGPLLCGVYLDDLLYLERTRLGRHPTGRIRIAVDLLEKAHRACETSGLQKVEKKMFRESPRFKAWGRR